MLKIGWPSTVPQRHVQTAGISMTTREARRCDHCKMVTWRDFNASTTQYFQCNYWYNNNW